MPDFTRKLTILGYLLFTRFCFWKAALGLTDVTDASVMYTTDEALSPSVSYKRAVMYFLLPEGLQRGEGYTKIWHWNLYE